MRDLLAAPRPALCLILCLTLGACASSAPWTCRAGEQPAVMDSIYFGSAKPGGGIVSAEDWRDFVNRVVTPRFPRGLTSLEASGQWRGRDGAIEREASHVLHVVHPDDAANERAVREVVQAYKSDFRQESVLRVRAAACTSF